MTCLLKRYVPIDLEYTDSLAELYHANKHHQKAITDLIMERFDKMQAKEAENGSLGAVEPAPTVNGAKHEDKSPPGSSYKRKQRDEEDEDMSEVDDSSPAPKKVKKSNGGVESDEKMAARLQAELNAQSRSTRGGGTTRRKPAAKKEKKTKKKSKAKVGSDDDSEVEGEEKPEKEKKGGFHVSLTNRQLQSCFYNIPAETHESLRTALCNAGRKPALPPADRQEDMGVRQGPRPARSLRQAKHPVRRRDAGGLQERQGSHVYHEQAPRHSSLPRRRSIASAT